MENPRFRMNQNCNYSGVYIIVNLDNRKVYIGSTRNIKRRLVEHEIKLRKGNHNSDTMQNDYNSGNKFIAYPLTRVELCAGYLKDNNLRFFEYRAIVQFDSANPNKGYNKRSDVKKSIEDERIKREKEMMDSCFSNFENIGKYKWATEEYAIEELNEFVSDRVDKCN